VILWPPYESVMTILLKESLNVSPMASTNSTSRMSIADWNSLLFYDKGMDLLNSSAFLSPIVAERQLARKYG